MKILALTPSMPSPPDRGVRIRSHHLLSLLAERHEISLLAVDDSAAGPRASGELAKFCVRHQVFPLSPLARALRGLLSLLRGDAIRVGWFQEPKLQATLEHWLDEFDFDLILVFSCAMAPYWLRSPRARAIPVLMDHIDAESEKWGQYARYAKAPRRWLFALEQRRLASLERRIESGARRSVLVSQAEVRALHGVFPASEAIVLPNGVDGARFARPQLTRRDDPPSLIFVGQMDDGANEDAVLHFANDILPLLRRTRPELRFDVVGARPSPPIKALRDLGGVRVTGWVEDVRPYLWKASLAVVPLRIAQGTQNKVLEAMAASLPVVATPLAARGIGRAEGPHIRVESDPVRFADAVLELLDDPVAARVQAQAALEMIHAEHSWQTAAEQLELLLSEAVGE